MRFVSPVLHRNLRIALLLVGAALMTLLLTQCQMVEERIAAPQLNLTAANSGSCISRCARAYADSNRVEAARFVQAMQDCEGVESCLDYQVILHQRAVTRITEARKQCLNDCHHQGSGSGGR